MLRLSFLLPQKKLGVC